MSKWKTWIQERHIAISEGVKLEDTLGDPIKVQEWFKAELPTDSFTVENTVIMNLTDKFTLAIDPQNQCNAFIKKFATEVLERKLRIFNAVTSTPEKDMKDLKRAISLGSIVLIENIQESINPALEPLLNKQIVKKGSMKIINIENEDIDYSDDFMLYMTTTLPRPHYSPEVCIMIKIVNYTATPEGLTDQMINTCIETVDNRIYKLQMGYAKEMAGYKMKEDQLTKDILGAINDETRELLDKQDLVDSLADSQDTSKKKTKYEKEMRDVKNKFKD